MRNILVIGLLGMMATACTGDENQFGYNGLSMETHFPFDGQRTWEFANPDHAKPYHLLATLDPTFVEKNEGLTRVYTVNYTTDCIQGQEGCENAFVRATQWSADRTRGVQIHGTSVVEGEMTAFDPPIKIANGQMWTDEFAITETAGTTFTSVMRGVVPCPVQWTDQWDSCVELELSDAPFDEATRSFSGESTHPLAGTYWAVTSFNVVAFDINAEDDRWELIYADYSQL